MAESNNPINTSGESVNDPLDISELASLNEDYSADFIEQLQNKLTETNGLNKKNVSMDTDDSELFEEVSDAPKQVNENLDDNFMKKYKARLQKQQNPTPEDIVVSNDGNETVETESEININDTNEGASVEDVVVISDKNDTNPVEENQEIISELKKEEEIDNSEQNQNNALNQDENKDIETVSGGNIIEKPLDKTQHEYNQSLNYLDQNTKYSKYVIYIDPENKDFIDSLTVKERKNLINRIIKEQDSVVVTKANLNKMQAIITHVIIAILTVIIAVPCIYWVFNAALESTINNYNTSQSMFKTLYKEHGKIQSSKVK